tara:strand:+ start:573 stop:917 length:345 start_codon:yes stop_codon:yes gene_type:complete
MIIVFVEVVEEERKLTDNRRRQSPIEKLIKKTTTRVNRNLKKRPVNRSTVQMIVGTIADLMIIEDGVGVEFITELLKHGKKRKIANNSSYTLEERLELLSKVNKEFSEKVSSEK